MANKEDITQIPYRGEMSTSFPTGTNHITHNSLLIQLFFVTFGHLLIVLSHLGNTVLMGGLHRVECSRFAQPHDLDEANGDIFSCVDVIVVNS